MPFRQRIKRALTRSSSSSDGGSSLSKSASNKPESNVYQPGEKMPPMKYRRPVAPEHKEKLESFSFARAWRRKSAHSQYSPMGSRMPSRKNSTATNGRKSFQATRLSMQAPRTASTVDPKQVKEGSDEEGDVTNVGLSRHPTQDPRQSNAVRRSGSRPRTGQKSGVDTPFSPEDLDLALKKTHLDVPQQQQQQQQLQLGAHQEVPTEPSTEVPTPEAQVTTPKTEGSALKHDSGVM